MVNIKRNKTSKPRELRGTIFVAKIHPKATARDVWTFFQKGGKILDIVLPKKRDKYNNRIRFVEVIYEEVTHIIVNSLKHKELLEVKLDLKRFL